MSGHSKWATTKRHKASIDAKRSNLFTKLARMITVAAKEGKNLDLAIENAKKASMPKENIERAIKKGTGEIKGEEIQSYRYEIYGPESVGIIVDVLTDNKNRSLSEIKAVLNKHNSKLASEGAVSYLFESQGIIELKKDKQAIFGDDLELVIIESGAKDYKIENDNIYIYTDAKKLSEIKKNLEFKSLQIESAKIEMSPQNYIAVAQEKKETIIKLLTALEELDDVSEIYTNADL